jgi:hypothetical protein
MTEVIKHWLNVRDKPGLLNRLMREFAGGQMSLEGDLSKCRFPDEMVVAWDEVGLLKRCTTYPRQDFVVLRLETESIAPMFKQIQAAGLSRAIIHAQIEHSGELQLGAYDNFHPDCVVAGPSVTESLLAELKSKHVLRDFSVAAAPDRSLT